jgi:hypothetical protein
MLVGPDAERFDELVRQSPECAYDVEFFESFAREGGWRVGSVRHADELEMRNIDCNRTDRHGIDRGERRELVVRCGVCTRTRVGSRRQATLTEVSSRAGANSRKGEDGPLWLDSRPSPTRVPTAR